MLHGAGCRRPTGVHVHGFLTVDGQKMSKSRGTFITARRYLELLPPEPLRYYFAAKLGSGLEDIDLSLEDFTARANSDIVGKLVNIASRCARLHRDAAAARLADALPDPALYAEFVAAGDAHRRTRTSRATTPTAIREIMALADRANQYVDQHKPWVLAKDPAQAGEVRGGRHAGHQPVPRADDLPDAGAAGHRRDAAGALPGPAHRRAGSDAATPLLGVPLNAYQPLATRLDPALVARLVDTPAAGDRPAAAPAAAVPATAVPATAAPAAAPVEIPAALITIDDFAKLDLRVARVLGASLRGGLGQAAAAAARPRRRAAQGVLRHPRELRARAARRPARGRDREPRAAQDALRRLRGHGAVRERRQAPGYSCSADAGVRPA